MSCPNCGDTMKPVNLDHITIDHCGNCGATFFDENEINRISARDARLLSVDKKLDSISGFEKLCPRDKTPLKTYTQESIPQFVTLLRCDKCAGIFAFADDLVNFKNAQGAKINYFKLWHIPAPPLKNLIVYSFLFVAAVSTLITVMQTGSQQQVTSRAEDIITTIDLVDSPDATLICFTTKYPFRSELIFTNSATQEQIGRTISDTPQKTHCKNIEKADIAPSQTTLYSIVLTSDKTRIQTDAKPFVPLTR